MSAKNVLSMSLTLVAASTMLAMPAKQAHAEEDGARDTGLRTYTIADFKGRYAFTQNGTIANAPIIEVGMMTADGKGKVSGISTFILGGTKITAPFNCNYTLAANGSGVMSCADNVNNVFELTFVLGNGNKFLGYMLSKLKDGTTGEEVTFLHTSGTGFRQ